MKRGAEALYGLIGGRSSAVSAQQISRPANDGKLISGNVSHGHER
jgi:hypothetical protein